MVGHPTKDTVRVREKTKLIYGGTPSLRQSQSELKKKQLIHGGIPSQRHRQSELKKTQLTYGETTSQRHTSGTDLPITERIHLI